MGAAGATRGEGVVGGTGAVGHGSNSSYGSGWRYRRYGSNRSWGSTVRLKAMRGTEHMGTGGGGTGAVKLWEQVHAKHFLHRIPMNNEAKYHQGYSGIVLAAFVSYH